MTSGRWTKGYTQTELDDAQEKFGLVFPPDLVALFRDRRPVDGHLWTDQVAIRRMLDWPFEGLLFDVEHNHLWWPEWGEKPANPDARRGLAISRFARPQIDTIDWTSLSAGGAARRRQPRILSLSIGRDLLWRESGRLFRAGIHWRGLSAATRPNEAHPL